MMWGNVLQVKLITVYNGHHCSRVTDESSLPEYRKQHNHHLVVCNQLIKMQPHHNLAPQVLHVLLYQIIQLGYK